ncbi:MAG: GNAT family N-acetyltransferase [Gaiellaceae bacterium]
MLERQAAEEPPFRLETITDGAALAALEEHWDALVCDMPRPSPFLLHGWLNEWWRHYADGRELRIELAWRGPRLVGALPWCITRRRGLRVGEFIGGHRSALGDLLLREGESDDLARELAGRAREGDFDLVDLFGLPANSRLAQAFPPPELRLIERVEAPVLDLGEGWENVYRSKTSARTRHLHRRRRRQLTDLGRVEVAVARTPDELEPALGEAFRLHELRWEGRPDGSEFTTPPGKRFHLAAALALAQRDAPRVVLLTLDRRPIAFHYFFALCGRMYVHRLGFDPALARFSPGLLNTLDAIAVAAEEGLTMVEFLGGTERYKIDLSDRFDPLYQGLGLAPNRRGRLVVASRVATIRARRRLRHTPALHRFYLERLAPARRAARRLRGRRR